MKTNKYLHKTMAGTVCFVLILGIALVQMPGTVVAQEEEEFTLEDTVVTATKTGETMLQETPNAITVFDDQMMADRSTFNLVELSDFMTSATLLPGFQGGVEGHIRGIGVTNIFIGADASIAFYLDGVYLYQGRGGNSDFLDVERIEVLRGPQGVTWGGNATGGAINVVTKKPSDELEMQAYYEIGNYSKRRVDAMISGPIIEGKMNARLSVSDNERDGFIDNLFSENDIADENYTAFRGSVQIFPRDNVDILIKGDYYKSKTHGYFVDRKLLDFNSSFGQLVASLGYSQEFIMPSDFWTVNMDLDTNIDTKFYGGSAEVTIDFPHDMTLVSLTAVRQQDQDHWSSDQESTAVPELYGNQIDTDQTAKWWSQEVRLSGTWGRLDWLLGGFYMDQENIGGPAWGFNDVDLNGPSFDIVYTALAERKAGFVNLTYAITDRLSGTAGVRYSDETKDIDVHFDIGMFPPFNFPPGGPRIIFVEDGAIASANWTAWTPKFVLDYKATEDLFLYARIEKGWRSGDLEPTNYVFTDADTPVGPESVWLYELGAKSDWFDKRLRLNAAVFTMDYEDLVVSSPLPNGLVLKQNAGTVDYKGVEIEAVARPTRNLTLNGAVTYMDSEFGSFITDNPRTGEFEDVQGNSAENVPKWKAVLGANYVVPIEGAGYLTFGANILYRDKSHWTLFPEDPTSWTEDYTVVNARVRFETEDGHWSLEAYGRNLFEEEYYRRHLIVNGTDDTWGRLQGDPLTMGIKATYYFRGGEKQETAPPPPPPPPPLPPPPPKDSDGDGVYDEQDQCPDTPKGVKVDASGCPLDGDGDGVPDYMDQCPDTPRGVKVDREGCPLDTDGDSVADYLDQCPNTPIGATVDERGCWTYSAVVLFDFDKAEVKPEAYPMFQEAVSIMKKNPDLKVEVDGHADSTGSAAYNMTLSEKRAEAVKDHFVSQGIDPDRLTTKGFGITKPAASNDTEEGRAKNRRVELTPIL